MVLRVMSAMTRPNIPYNPGHLWCGAEPTTGHQAANRQQPDDPSGVESTHPEHTGRLRVAPVGRAFTNHWKGGPYLPQG